MASSFSQKSSSSASKAPKPTYRRASAPSKAPAASPTARRRAAGASPVKKGAGASMRPQAKVKAKAVKSPALGAVAGKAKAAKSTSVRAAGGSGAVKSPLVRAAAAKAGPASKRGRIAVVPKMSKASVARGASAPAAKGARLVPSVLRPVASLFGSIGHLLGRALSGLHIPKPSRAALFVGAGGALALVLAAVLIVNSPLFSASDIQVRGSDHVEQSTAQALVEVPEGTSLLNVDEGAILEGLKASPWVKGVSIERKWPHTLVITPVERQMRAIAYITADELAWAIGEDGTWIAPVTLMVAEDAQGNEVALNEDGSVPEGATLLSSQDAAHRLAQDAGCLLLTDVPSDVSPKSGEPVASKVVLAGLDYANGFSPEFVATIKSLSIASVEAISANLDSGVEVSLGAPEHIVEKERVITKLIEQEVGVTFINVREPGAYTFRSAPH